VYVLPLRMNDYIKRINRHTDERYNIHMLPCNTGALPSYFRDSPKWHRGSVADAQGRAVAYRDAPGRTGTHRSASEAIPWNVP